MKYLNSDKLKNLFNFFSTILRNYISLEVVIGYKKCPKCIVSDMPLLNPISLKKTRAL